MPSLLCIRGRRTSCSLPFPIWVLSQAPDHSTKVSKVGETPYIVLSFYYIMEYIYLSIYIYKHCFSMSSAFFPEAGANPLWCDLKHRLCCSTAIPALHCPKHLPEGQEGPRQESKWWCVWLTLSPCWTCPCSWVKNSCVFEVLCINECSAGLRPNTTGEAKQTELSISTYRTKTK